MFDFFLIAVAAYDSRVVLGNANLVSGAEIIQGSAFQFSAHIFGDDMAAGQNSDVFQHSLAAVTESRSFDSSAFQSAAESVHYESCQSFAFYVFCNDQQFLAAAGNLFEELEHILEHVDLLVCDQDQRIINHAFHLVRIGYHVRGKVSAVKLHAFYNLQAGAHGLGVFYSNNTVISYLFHSVCNESADLLISRGNGSNLCNGFLGVNRNSSVFNFLNKNANSFFNALLQDHRICTGCYVSHAFMNHGLSKQSCGGCAVACYVIGLCCDFLYELSAHIFKGILQFDFAGNGYTVIDNVRSAEFLVQNNIPAFRSQSNFYCVSQLINAL